MTSDENRLLTHMKKLIFQGKRRFQIRSDRNYIEDLLELGLTVDEAWYHIITLNSNFYFSDSKQSYYKSKDTLIFKKLINDNMVYIKLQLDKNIDEVVVCLSFHKDFKRVK